MSNLEAVILGLLQGLTEFLPVSSSGHLVLVEHLMELPVSEYLLFDILLHLATLLAICIYFYRRLVDLWKSGLTFFSKQSTTEQTLYDRQMILGVCLSTGVTIIFGLIIKFTGTMDLMREQLLLVGLCFLATAVLLVSTRYRNPQQTAIQTTWPIHFMGFALLMGLAQSFAILPGISRSGATVCTALLLGASKQQSVEYSFVMSIPAILCAMAYESLYATWSVSVSAALMGFAASLISGILFLWMLVWIVGKGKLHQFAIYLVPLGIWVVWSAL